MSEFVAKGLTSSPDRTSPGVAAVLAIFAFVTLSIGLWQTLAPASFYESFPGFGMQWVSVDGPYNEHLMRDTGEGNLGIGVLVALAATTRAVLLARVAALALTVANLPHTVYHLLHVDELATTADQLLNTAVVLIAALSALGLVVATFRSQRSSEPAVRQPAH